MTTLYIGYNNLEAKKVVCTNVNALGARLLATVWVVIQKTRLALLYRSILSKHRF